MNDFIEILRDFFSDIDKIQCSGIVFLFIISGIHGHARHRHRIRSHNHKIRSKYSTHTDGAKYTELSD